MKRAFLLVLVLFLMILLFGCEATKDTMDKMTRVETSSSMASVNTYTVTSGTGNVIIKKVTIMSYPSYVAAVELQKSDDGTVLSTFSAHTGTGTVINTTGLVPAGTALEFWTRITHLSGCSSGHSIGAWSFQAPSSSQNIIYDHVVMVPRYYLESGSYFDVSEGIVTTNPNIDWDMQLVSYNVDSVGTHYIYLEFRVSGDCRIYAESASTNMSGYVVDDVSLMSSVSSNGSRAPHIVFKTREGRYGYLDYAGGNINTGTDLYMIHVDCYYYPEGTTSFYDPDNEMPAGSF